MYTIHTVHKLNIGGPNKNGLILINTDKNEITICLPTQLDLFL